MGHAQGEQCIRERRPVRVRGLSLRQKSKSINAIAARLCIARTFWILWPLKELPVLDNVATGIVYRQGKTTVEEARAKAIDVL